MGHMVGKDIYRKLGKKIDGLTLRAPWNEALRAILTELYTPEEADLVVKMPFRPSTIEQIEKLTGYNRADLRKRLDSLSEKGLVMDLWLNGGCLYIISPFVIGIFEFTMMRTRGELNYKEWARLFTDYMGADGRWYASNFGKGQKMSPLRAIPHEGTVEETEFVEVLDYEKATAIVEQADKFAIGLCSCRHEKLHLGEKKCDVPLETCSTFGKSAQHLVRHGLAREVSKTEMMENLARSREMGLVFCADNVKKDISFICHCCGCCCNVLRGISKYGYPHVLVTSNYIAQTDADECTACGTCAESCPIDAIETMADDSVKVDESLCVGCGVCALNCTTESMKLVERKQRVLTPETTFERVILQCLEQGTLQNLLFANPQSLTHGFMRGLVGGFLRLPPVKKSLMSDALRSKFLKKMAG